MPASLAELVVIDVCVCVCVCPLSVSCPFCSSIMVVCIVFEWCGFVGARSSLAGGRELCLWCDCTL